MLPAQRRLYLHLRPAPGAFGRCVGPANGPTQERFRSSERFPRSALLPPPRRAAVAGAESRCPRAKWLRCGRGTSQCIHSEFPGAFGLRQELSDQSDSAAIAIAPNIFQASGQFWNVRKFALAQEPANLEIRIDARLNAPEQFEEVFLSKKDRCIAAFGFCDRGPKLFRRGSTAGPAQPSV